MKQVNLFESVLNKESINIYKQEFIDIEEKHLLNQYKNKCVQIALKSLTLKERTIILLSDTAGIKQIEISRLFRVNPSTVSRTLKRARKKLRNQLIFLQ